MAIRLHYAIVIIAGGDQKREHGTDEDLARRCQAYFFHSNHSSNRYKTDKAALFLFDSSAAAVQQRWFLQTGLLQQPKQSCCSQSWRRLAHVQKFSGRLFLQMLASRTALLGGTTCLSCTRRLITEMACLRKKKGWCGNPVSYSLNSLKGGLSRELYRGA